MSEREFSRDENVPHVSEDNVDEAESSSSGNEGRELEAQEDGRPPIGSESRDSGHDSPLEGAVGGEIENDIVGGTRDKKLLKADKADLFRRFFSDEYTQVKIPILDRHRHDAQRQRPRQGPLLDGSHTQSSLRSSPSGHQQLKELILNQADSVMGKTIPSEFEQFSNEDGQVEDSEKSIGSIDTPPFSDYAGNLLSSRPSSDDNRGLSPGLSFPSISPNPSTAASDNIKDDNPLPNSESPVSCRLSPTPLDSETVEREKPARRRFGISKPMPIRSKSALAGCSVDCAGQSSDRGDNFPKRKISKDMSVCSEPLPERKIFKDSSVDSFERMSSDDEATNYPELSHSLESDSSVPIPDLYQEEAENVRENLDALQVSSDVASETKPDVVDESVEQRSEDESV